MNTRRSFLQKLSCGTVGALTLPSFLDTAAAGTLEDLNVSMAHLSPSEIAQNEDFWSRIKLDYTVSPNVLNLNNGGASPQPKPVQDAHIRFYQYCNEAPTYYMWRILDQGREALRGKLADLAGCDPEEIAINRNSTEGLNTIIFGLNLKAGDEVVLNKKDYPSMMNAWKQREKRDGIKLVWVDLDLPSEDENAIVKKYTDLFTSKTKIVHITHVVNWIGQIMPVKKITEAARKKGIESIVDGAHSFAHLDYTIPELGCDYYATSLHKWLGAPLGSGMMYIRKDKIKNVWALLSSPVPDSEDIRKFETLGTRSFASEMAIGTAVDYHNAIGNIRKFERLHFLQRYWTDKARNFPHIKVHTSPDPKYACALALVSAGDLTLPEMDNILMGKYKIHTTGVDYDRMFGIRITPNVYTSLKDLDRLVAALQDLSADAAKKGINLGKK